MLSVYRSFGFVSRGHDFLDRGFHNDSWRLAFGEIPMRVGWMNGSIAVVAVLAVVGAGYWMNAKPEHDSEREFDLNVRFQPPKKTSEFDGKSALNYLTDICKLGPRITDSKPMHRQIEILTEHFEQLGANVSKQTFSARQPSRPTQPFECTNLVVKWHVDRPRRLLLGCHYDTRPMADREPPLSRRKGVFLGANDGASGVGFLMELGRLMPELDTKFGVDFVFFDAEEYILDTTRDEYFIGSTHFANSLARKDVYEAIVVLDMIADKNLEIHPEMESSFRSQKLCAEIWQVARDLKIREFNPRPKHSVRDDHEPFLKLRMNAMVLIDFDYPHWHRLSDVPANCSAASLGKVGDVIIEWLKRRP
jgi:hypothetical protein